MPSSPGRTRHPMKPPTPWRRHAFFSGTSASCIFAIDRPAARPAANSMTRTGIPRSARLARYARTKSPPPDLPATYGKRHTFPSPIAHPAESNMKPRRLASFSLIYPPPSRHSRRLRPERTRECRAHSPSPCGRSAQERRGTSARRARTGRDQGALGQAGHSSYSSSSPTPRNSKSVSGRRAISSPRTSSTAATCLHGFA